MFAGTKRFLLLYFNWKICSLAPQISFWWGKCWYIHYSSANSSYHEQDEPLSMHESNSVL